MELREHQPLPGSKVRGWIFASRIVNVYKRFYPFINVYDTAKIMKCRKFDLGRGRRSLSLPKGSPRLRQRVIPEILFLIKTVGCDGFFLLDQGIPCWINTLVDPYPL